MPTELIKFGLLPATVFSGGYGRTDRATSCVAIAGSGAGMERDYSGDSRIFQNDLRCSNEIGREAGKRAVERIGARKPPTGTFPVLFDERISSSLISHLLAAANGSAVARGASWLRGKLGTQILPKELNLIEDPHRPRTSGTRPFDAEGLPTQRRAIIENGVLLGWTLDLASARKLDMTPTANAARGTGGTPGPTNWNVSLNGGTASRDDLISDMGTGLLVTCNDWVQQSTQILVTIRAVLLAFGWKMALFPTQSMNVR